MRRALRIGLRLLLALALFALAAEGAMRVLRPTPPIQVVRERAPVPDLDGVPMWRHDAPRSNEACLTRHPDARVVAFSGDSIFFGIEVPGPQAMTAVTQAILDAAHGPGAWCVLNLSQAGFSFDQKRAWLRSVLARHRVDLVYWEVWPNDAARYVRVGDSIYNLAGVDPADPEPLNRLGLPTAIDRALLRASRFYEYAMLLRVPRFDLTPEWLRDVYAPRLAALRDEVAAAGAALVLVLPPPLDRPFASRGAGRDDARMLAGVVERLDPGAVFLGEELGRLGVDHLAVRLDPCCHYNAEGHRVIGTLFAKRLLARWPAPPAAPAASPGSP